MNLADLNMSCLIGLGGGLQTGPGWKGTSGIKGLLSVIFSFAMFMEFVGSLECTLFFLFLFSFSQEFSVTGLMVD